MSISWTNTFNIFLILDIINLMGSIRFRRQQRNRNTFISSWYRFSHYTFFKLHRKFHFTFAKNIFLFAFPRKHWLKGLIVHVLLFAQLFYIDFWNMLAIYWNIPFEMLFTWATDRYNVFSICIIYLAHCVIEFCYDWP